MGGKIVGDVLCALPDPNVLIAADVRDDLHAIENGRGTIDKGRRSIERIRHDTVHPDMGMVGLERLKQAQGELFFRGILGIGRWFGGPLFFGDPLLLEGLFLLIPRTELRGRLIEDKAHGDGDFGGHQDEKDEALSPQRATTFFIAQFILKCCTKNVFDSLRSASHQAAKASCARESLPQCSFVALPPANVGQLLKDMPFFLVRQTLLELSLFVTKTLAPG